MWNLPVLPALDYKFSEDVDYDPIKCWWDYLTLPASRSGQLDYHIGHTIIQPFSPAARRYYIEAGAAGVYPQYFSGSALYRDKLALGDNCITTGNDYQHADNLQNAAFLSQFEAHRISNINYQTRAVRYHNPDSYAIYYVGQGEFDFHLWNQNSGPLEMLYETAAPRGLEFMYTDLLAACLEPMPGKLSLERRKDMFASDWSYLEGSNFLQPAFFTHL